MKKICFLLAVLLGKSTNAQYFQHLYGGLGLNDQEYNWQMIPASPGNGYILVGDHFTNASPAYTMHYVHTDNNGTALTNRHYAISDQNGSYDSYATSVSEVNAGPLNIRYAVAGTVAMTPDHRLLDVLLMNCNVQGTPLYIKRYTIPTYALRNPRVKTSLDNTTVFITGDCKKAPPFQGTDEVFIMSINFVTGNLNWGHTYDLQNPVTFQSLTDKGIDIIQNPYVIAPANPQLLVVGESNATGLLLKVDATNGAPIGAPVTYGPTASQKLSCIRVSANPLVLSNDAFVVGGSMLMGAGGAPNFDMWTMLIDQNGNVTWSTTHNTANAQPFNNFCYDIIERGLGLGGMQYYAVGDWKDPNPGLWPKIQTLKLGTNGTLLANGEFLYGNPLHLDFGRSIAFSNTGGITISGTKASINAAFNSNQLLINAYFSGHTNCDYSISTFNSVTNLITPFSPRVEMRDDAESFDMNAELLPLPDSNICYSVTEPFPASNAREALLEKEPQMFGFKIKNNGTKSALQNGGIDISLENSLSYKLDVQVVDMLGRPIACQLDYDPSDLKKSDARIIFNKLPKGMYYVVISDGHSQHSQALFVQ